MVVVRDQRLRMQSLLSWRTYVGKLPMCFMRRVANQRKLIGLLALRRQPLAPPKKCSCFLKIPGAFMRII
jgi:hypothetical protein